jgi:hypothetical protein
VDIDLDVPDDALSLIARKLAAFVVFGPGRYQDDRWDLDLLTVVYRGISIDIGGCQARIFSARTQSWVSAEADLDSAEELDVQGTPVFVVNRTALVTYKTLLDREVDRLDIAAMHRSADDISSM